MGFWNSPQVRQSRLFQNKKVKKEHSGMILNDLEFLCWQGEDSDISQDTSS